MVIYLLSCQVGSRAWHTCLPASGVADLLWLEIYRGIVPCKKALVSQWNGVISVLKDGSSKDDHAMIREALEKFSKVTNIYPFIRNCVAVKAEELYLNLEYVDN